MKSLIIDFVLKVMHVIWSLVPLRLKIIIFNLSKAFYQRHKTQLKNPAFSKLPKLKSGKSDFKFTADFSVSIIIPTFNNYHFLKKCLESIKKNTAHKHYEIILIDNNTFDKKCLNLMNTCGHKVLKYSYKFNFSKANNFAAQHAKGEYLVFLNNDTAPLKNWLEFMLAELNNNDVGIVGSKLLFYDNTIQHAGIEFDHNNLSFVNSFMHQHPDIKDANSVKEVAAVTGACLMVRKELFLKVGGFDTDYWVESQDVDLCFKIRKLGYKVIYTPYSVLYHDEGSTRGPVERDASIYDSLRLRRKWLNDYLIVNANGEKLNQPQKILLIKLLSMGDVVMATAIIESIRKKFPCAEIVFATSQKNKDIVEGNRYLDRFYICRDFDRTEFNNELNYYRSITQELFNKENWDLAYQIQILDLPYGYWGTDYHLRDLYADLANVNISGSRPYIPITDVQRLKIKTILNGDIDQRKKIILLHTTSGWQLKDWDYKKYALLAHKIREAYNVKIFQIGGPSDIAVEDSNVVPLQGKLNLKEVAALMECSDLLICPDSGLMHMASAINIPIIALFGPTSPSTGGPINANNYICIQSDSCCDTPCHMRRCFLGNDCAKDIAVNQVFNAAKALLDRSSDIKKSWWKQNSYEGLAREVFNNRSGTGGFRC